MKRISTILLLTCISSNIASDVLWNDDKTQKDLYNCDGFVTDAICCQDKVCQGQTSESSCTSGEKRKLFCAWDSNHSKCLAVRDNKNNVCCQKKPIEGCDDLVKGRCPENYQVTFLLHQGFLIIDTFGFSIQVLIIFMLKLIQGTYTFPKI